MVEFGDSILLRNQYSFIKLIEYGSELLLLWDTMLSLKENLIVNPFLEVQENPKYNKANDYESNMHKSPVIITTFRRWKVCILIKNMEQQYKEDYLQNFKKHFSLE